MLKRAKIMKRRDKEIVRGRQIAKLSNDEIGAYLNERLHDSVVFYRCLAIAGLGTNYNPLITTNQWSWKKGVILNACK